MDIRDLLTDNVSLIQQLDTFGGNHAFPSLPGMLRPRLREVTSLPSWIYYFLAYIAIRATDLVVRDMLAYARLMVRGLRGMVAQAGGITIGASTSRWHWIPR